MAAVARSFRREKPAFSTVTAGVTAGDTTPVGGISVPELAGHFFVLLVEAFAVVGELAAEDLRSWAAVFSRSVELVRESYQYTVVLITPVVARGRAMLWAS